MLKTLRFISSVLFVKHTLSNKSIRVWQLGTKLSNLTGNGKYLSPANKNLLNFHSLYTFEIKEDLLKKFYLKVSLFLNY